MSIERDSDEMAAARVHAQDRARPGWPWVAARVRVVCVLIVGAESIGFASARGPESFEQALPATTSTIRMVHVPGDAALGVPDLWMSTTEITWDAYDVFLYGLDVPGGVQTGTGADAIARPSKPYVPPDRGFGHAGYPAIGMTRRGAEAFCVWLSERSGRAYRLPTADEWRHACAAGGQEVDGETAWTLENSAATTHPAGSLRACGLGLHDMHGNVAEWVSDPSQTRGVALGGSFMHAAGEERLARSRRPDQQHWGLRAARHLLDLLDHGVESRVARGDAGFQEAQVVRLLALEALGDLVVARKVQIDQLVAANRVGYVLLARRRGLQQPRR